MSKLALLILTLLLAIPASASALPIMEPQDQEELTVILAEASEEQGICYGWSVQVTDDGGDLDGIEQGSSLGPNTPINPTDCPKFVTVTGNIHYTSDFSESEDSADISVQSNLAKTPSEDSLPADEEDLLGDKDDEALFKMVEALPFLTADLGLAPFITVEEPSSPPPAADAPTNSPGSDWWRMYWWVVLLAVIGVGALIFLIVAVANSRGAY